MKRAFVTLLVAALCTVAAFVPGPPAGAYGRPVIIQNSARNLSAVGGRGASGGEAAPAVSRDGRYVAFSSQADDLIGALDTNDKADVFVRDVVTAETTRVSVDSFGREGSGDSWATTLSGDGRWVIFSSDAPDLVAGDNNHHRDIFAHDRLTGVTTRLALSTEGAEANGQSDNPSVSADGRFVVFESKATNLVGQDTLGVKNIFLRDRDTDMDGILDEVGAVSTTLVSRASSGVPGDADSVTPAISADGSTIAFASDAGNLSSTDVDGVMDIFVTKRETIGPALISLLCNFPPPTPDGGVACLPINFDGSSRNPSISASGEVVAFETDADHLAGDDNGVTDVYVTDLTGGGRLTERVSVADDGSEAQGASRFSSVSADGTLVAFASEADNLVAGVTRTQDIFIRSRSAHTTMRASVNRDGDSPDGVSRSPRLVPDGSAVAFASDADDLVAQDANGLLSDVFTASICVPDSSEGAVSSLLRSVVGPNAGPFQGSIELLGCSVASWGL